MDKKNNCDQCGKKTEDMFGGVKVDVVCRCEKCNMKLVIIDRKKYNKKYKKAIKWLKQNQYVIKVEENESIRIFEIKKNLMECISIIRKEMKEENFFENYLDVTFQTFEKCPLEIVNYLFFVKYGTEKDKNGRFKELDSKTFYIELLKK